MASQPINLASELVHAKVMQKARKQEKARAAREKNAGPIPKDVAAFLKKRGSQPRSAPMLARSSSFSASSRPRRMTGGGGGG